jgi:hypothetical protein
MLLYKTDWSNKWPLAQDLRPYFSLITTKKRGNVSTVRSSSLMHQIIREIH